ncbi:hypothetical protein GCM10007916_27910 [Psychromonas marina]|uniref:histidine kinase n=1 Tax=Psychromonas marina TaxID=88364 RepID=A0ABQ6E2T6_9GAMM|nr:ATP-binding protein [Psychromonas marina]GLS91721.1 hypothetical protein GCM10007916_27910 [Psychromonas marina]
MVSLFKRKIIIRVVLGYLLALALTLAIVFLTLSRLNNINNTVDELTNRLAVTRALSQRVVSQLHEVRFYADRYLRFYNQKDLDLFNTKILGLKQSQQEMSKHTKKERSLGLIQYIKQETGQYELEFSEITKLIMYQQSLLSTVFIKQELLIENHLSAIRVNVGIVQIGEIFLSFGNARNSFELMRLFQSKYLSGNDEKYFVMFKKNYQYASQAFTDLSNSLNAIEENPHIALTAAKAKAALKIYYETFIKIHSVSIKLNQLSGKLDHHEFEISQAASLLAQGIEAQYKAHNELTQTLVSRTQFELLGAVIIAILLNLALIFVVLRYIIAPIFQRMQQEALQLKAAKNKAEVANRVKSEFVANMSHELRTPLNAVIGFSELLSSMVVDTKQKSFIHSIKTAGSNLLMLINDVLDLSKIEVGKLKLQQSPVNLAHLLDEIEQIFSLNVMEKNLTLSIYCPVELPNFLYLDNLRFRQVLINLVGNAIKFTDQGHIKVSVGITEKSLDSIDLVISVIDTGIGIPLENQQKIFNSFEQQSNQNAIKYGGTGLGLSITKRLVELMGGNITLTSMPKEGSQFDVFIPNVKITKLETSMYETEGGVVEAINFSPVNVLVADDVEFNRILLDEFLTKKGLNITTVNNGHEALLAVQKMKPDLIIMDIRMPLMSGIEAAKKLQENISTANIPIIALTSSVSQSDKSFALTHGFSDFLSKPINFTLLLKVLSGYLAHSYEQQGDLLSEKPPVEIILENINQPSVLLMSLQRDILPALEQLKKAFILSDYKQLGLQLNKLSFDHKIEPLLIESENIRHLSDSFNIKGMNKSINKLTQSMTALALRLEEGQ